ncbi:gephyrin-like molybdotransferase Glp [Marinomonas sp. THO17]|uniref:molybdopterin molybdotransferase MoeA n=1 Tax=Marinomonas sp. THO17 TaxID=3149048 RepID=UPI00336BE37B
MSGLMAFEDALKAIEASACPLVKTQTLALTNALGHVLAQDVKAPMKVPPAANSAMDGYALAFQDWQPNKGFHISQRIAAGQAPSLLEPGSCARIFTGAILPAGADTVIMQENAEVTGDQVRFLVAPKQGANVRPEGQDMEQGQMVLHAGQRLQAIQIGLLASLGITKVKVYCPLKVGILTTGDELIAAGQGLQTGQIYNSNGPMLQALVIQAGHQVSQVVHAADTPQATEAALQKLFTNSDLILSSGGVSVGEEDHVKAVLEKLGQLHLWKIAIKPGKPLVYATLNGIPFLGLPGNPSSTLVTFHWFARLLLSGCAGESITRPQAFSIQAGFERKKAIQRDEFLRVHLEDGKAYPHPQQSSGALLAASDSDGYLHIKTGQYIDLHNHYDFYPFSSF